MNCHLHRHRPPEEQITLNVGGHFFQTSLDVMTRIEDNFFSVYFSGKYNRETDREGRFLIDRDGSHFAYVLSHLRDSGNSNYNMLAALPKNPRVLDAVMIEFDFYGLEVPMEIVVLLSPSGGVDVYDNDKDIKIPPPMHNAEYGATSVYLNDYLYMIGGRDDKYRGGTTTNLVSRYSIIKNSWEKVVPLPDSRFQHSTVTVGNSIYVIGGFTETTLYDQRYNTVLRFNTENPDPVWEYVKPMPHYLIQMAVAVVGQSIYVFGGNNGLKHTDNILKYDTVNNVWTQLNEHCPLLIGYEQTHAVTLSDGMVYIVGGDDSHMKTVQFDPVRRKFKQLAPLPEKVKRTCRESSSCFVRRHSLYFTCIGKCYMQVYRYCVESNTWTKIVRGFTGRLRNRAYGQAVTIMGDGERKNGRE
jgi:hypothetical protein